MRSIQVIRNFIKTRGSVRWGIALSILLSVILMPSCASASPSPQLNESIKISGISQSGENIQPGDDHELYENQQTSELPLPDLQEQLAAFPEDYSSEQALKDGFLVFNTFAGQSANKYWESSYAYLIVYEQEEGRYVFLMQDNGLTYEDLLKSMTSSSSAARIDCQLLFVIPA